MSTCCNRTDRSRRPLAQALPIPDASVGSVYEAACVWRRFEAAPCADTAPVHDWSSRVSFRLEHHDAMSDHGGSRVGIENHGSAAVS